MCAFLCVGMVLLFLFWGVCVRGGWWCFGEVWGFGCWAFFGWVGGFGVCGLFCFVGAGFWGGRPKN